MPNRKNPVPPKKFGSRQTDAVRRKKIENAAIDFVKEYFGVGGKGLGYEIKSKEQENVGYDLLVWKGDVTLCVEVKGRSGDSVEADFSRNECNVIKSHEVRKFEDGDYRICIVTDALNERQNRELHHYSWWPDKKKWIRVDGSEQLYFQPSGAMSASTNQN